jgi:hypothetical protein
MSEPSSFHADWQWSAELAGLVSPETDGPPRAFLWIPPDCDRVRGIVVGQHNMQEEPILEHPVFRAALRELGFAAIWISPPLDFVFDFEVGVGAHFHAMLTSLARISGYAEIEWAPVVPLGHSAAAGYPWNFARWAPERTLALISLSGQWPYGDETPSVFETDSALDGIPALVSMGEYEWADERIPTGLKQRAAHPALPLTMLAESGSGQFDLSEEKVGYLSLYLRKAAAHRLPAAWPLTQRPRLSAIDPTKTGWLVDRWRTAEGPRVPSAPVSEYAEPEEAFWCFDEEHAVVTERFRLDQRGKRVALLGYVQNDQVLPQDAGTHQQVTIPFAPLADGITFKLGAQFLEIVPKGRPERWTGLAEGARMGHPGNPEAISIDRICGPVQKLAVDTFAIRFSRVGLHNRKRSAELWFAATHPGDAQFKRSVQQALLRLPLRNEEGAEQRIEFAPIPDQPRNGKVLPLRATSNAAGAEVFFYVREGPAVLARDGRTLLFTSIPPRAKFPVQVTVVAWQWGRSVEPKLKTAAVIERTFSIEG